MNLAEKLTTWAKNEQSVRALVLIGSRVRPVEDSISQADANSDWDFQIICNQPRMFLNRDWTIGLDLDPYTYCVRRAAIGGVPKIAALFATADADFVILSARQLLLARWLVSLGIHRRSARLHRGLQDLAIIVRPGWQFLKGASEWEPFYRRVVRDVNDPRLANEDIRDLADNFVCDATWTLKKIQRGESLAAQRMLHRSLAETNFRLLHELKLRLGKKSFPEARRSEFVLSEDDLAAVTVDAAAEPVALQAALEKSSETCRGLLRALVGESWRWPVGRQGSGLHTPSATAFKNNAASFPDNV